MKVFLSVVLLGTFNFFLASTTDVLTTPHNSVEEETHESKEKGMLTGEVVIDTHLGEGEIHVFLYPKEQYNFLSEVSRQLPFGGATAHSIVNTEGSFLLEKLPIGTYDLRFVFLKDNFSYLPLKANTMGNVDLENIEVSEATDLRVNLSFESALVAN